MANKIKPIFFNRWTYVHSNEEQVNKDSELDIIGSVSISEQVTMMLARGELDKFLKEQSLNNFRDIVNNDITDDDISILNIKHIDRHDLNTHFNKIRSFYKTKAEEFIAQQLSKENTQPSETVTSDTKVSQS